MQEAFGHPDARQQDQVPSPLQGFQAGWCPHPGQPAQHLLRVEELSTVLLHVHDVYEKLALLLPDSHEQSRLILLVSEK